MDHPLDHSIDHSMDHTITPSLKLKTYFIFLGILVVIVVRRRRDRDDSRGAYTAGGSAFATTHDDYKPIVRGDFSSSASSTPSGTEV